MNVVSYHHAACEQTAIVKLRGHKLITVVMIDDAGLVCKSGPLSEERHMSPLTYKNKPYPLGRAVRSYKRVGKKRGSTQRALRELKRVTL